MKLPWMQWFPSDWFRDTRCLTYHAKGCWMDLICVLWDSKTRGTKTLDMAGWSLEMGKPIADIKAAFAELKKRDICDVVTLRNGDVTVTSRRQVREEKARQQARSRVARFRERQSNAAINACVTPESHISDVRSQKKRGGEKHPMPEGWSLSDSMMRYGGEKGMSSATLLHEFENCKEHHKKVGSRFTHDGWEASVWRTWVLKWVKFGSVQIESARVAPPQQKCAYSNSPCEEYVVAGSRYCAEHKALIAKQQERMKGPVVELVAGVGRRMP